MFKEAFFLTVIHEEVIEGSTIRYPDLDERIRDDWRIIGIANGTPIVHVIDYTARIARLNQDATYLGKDYKHIAQKAKQSDANCIAAIDEIIATNWEIDNPGEGPPRINKRGNLKAWKLEGRPPKLTAWLPEHVWFGHEGIEIPTEEEAE